MPYTYEYPRPMVTVDVLVIAPGPEGKEILLIRRGNDPFKGEWALPGGFLDLDEELEDAARRELHEETGLSVSVLREIGVFGAIGRDPRGRTITAAYLALLDERPAPRAGDDAAEAAWFPFDARQKLAFDHEEIIKRAAAML
jgi:8-oxo-dGTP diphosphatase